MKTEINNYTIEKLRIEGNGAGTFYLMAGSKEIATFTNHADGNNNLALMNEDDDTWEYIVRAVNSHKRLIGKLKDIVGCLSHFQKDIHRKIAKRNIVSYITHLEEVIAEIEEGV